MKTSEKAWCWLTSTTDWLSRLHNYDWNTKNWWLPLCVGRARHPGRGREGLVPPPSCQSWSVLTCSHWWPGPGSPAAAGSGSRSRVGSGSSGSVRSASPRWAQSWGGWRGSSYGAPPVSPPGRWPGCPGGRSGTCGASPPPSCSSQAEHGI